jgi:hypothetical protein
LLAAAGYVIAINGGMALRMVAKRHGRSVTDLSTGDGRARVVQRLAQSDDQLPVVLTQRH